MFDIDGTLVNSSKFDEYCYIQTAKELLGIEIPADINEFKHATDSGILDEIIDRFNVPGDKNQIHETFKKNLLKNMTEQITCNTDRIEEIKGASKFLKYLQGLDHVKIAIATGCWEETARLKLDAANIDITGLPFASSSDHYIRTEIMKLAESRVMDSISFQSIIYFGDAVWDFEASNELGYEFMLVGNRIEHEKQIDDYQRIDEIMSLLKRLN